MLAGVTASGSRNPCSSKKYSNFCELGETQVANSNNMFHLIPKPGTFLAYFIP